MSALKMLASFEDARLIDSIARRAINEEVAPSRDHTSIAMDLTATHLNGCPMRLQELLDADRQNFWHDINGIERHLDRKTGQLGGFFSPRCSR